MLYDLRPWVYVSSVKYLSFQIFSISPILHLSSSLYSTLYTSRTFNSVFILFSHPLHFLFQVASRSFFQIYLPVHGFSFQCSVQSNTLTKYFFNVDVVFFTFEICHITLALYLCFLIFVILFLFEQFIFITYSVFDYHNI